MPATTESSVANRARRTGPGGLARPARLVAGLLLLLLLSAAAGPAAAAATISQIRYGLQGELTRVVLDTDLPITFGAVAEAAPWRLVVELPAVSWRLRQGPLTAPRGIALAGRAVDLGPDRSQFHVETRGPFRIAATMLLPPAPQQTAYRMVIDLAPLTGDSGGGLRGSAQPAAPLVTAPLAAAPPAAAPGVAPVPQPVRSAEVRAGPPPLLPMPRPPATGTIAGLPVPIPERLDQAAAAAPPRPADLLEPPFASSEADAAPALPAVALPPPPAPPALPMPRPSRADEVQVAAIPNAALRPDRGRDRAEMPAARRLIMLDPGHGGADPGTVGVKGLLEKDIVLAMAERLKAVLEESGRYRVVLTRSDDTFIPLRDRIHLAREAKAQLFVSLHADSIARDHFRGSSVYTLSDKASDVEAELLASKENKTDIIGGADLTNHDPMVTSILIELALRDSANRSIRFADILAAKLAAVTPMVRKNRRFADFAVLKSPDFPSILLELGYLSNADDAANLVDPEWRGRVARAMLRALDSYFEPPRS